MQVVRRVAAMFAAMVTLLAADSSTAGTEQFRYFRMSGGTGNMPSSPGADGKFAITIDGPSTVFLGKSYVFTATSVNAQGPVSFAVQSGQLPAGISLDPATGGLSGTVVALGFTEAIIQGTDSATGTVASAALAVDAVETFAVSANNAPTSGAVAAPYSATFQVQGGTQPYTITSSQLPDGLVFTPSATAAAISGSPSKRGGYPVTINAADAAGLQASFAYNLTVGPSNDPALSAVVAAPSQAMIGQTYMAQTSITGGYAAGGYTATMVGVLPAGLSIDTTTGNITGIPSAVGNYGPLAIAVSDAHDNSTSSSQFSISVSDELRLTASLPQGTTGRNYSGGRFVATGGAAPYIYSITEGALPSGLSLAPNDGTISGTPSLACTCNVTVTSTDANGFAATLPATIVVTDPPPLRVSAPIVQNGYIGTPMTFSLSASGGSGQGYVFSWASADAFPPGVSLDTNSGLVSGTPYDYYDRTLTFSVSDSTGATASSPARIHIFGPLSISGIPEQDATVGTFYQATQPRAYGGTETGYAYDLVSGSLPPGLIIGPSGFISGIPTTSGSFDNLRVRVTDSQGSTAISPAFSIVVTDAGTTVDPVSAAFTSVALPVRVGIGQHFEITLEGYGGYNSGPYEFHEDATLPLPAGVRVDRYSGTISGAVSSVGIHPLRVVVVDVSHPDNVSGYSEQGNLIVSSFLVDTSPDPGFGRVGQNMNMRVVANGSGGPFNYALGSGALPPGLALDANSGVIAGTPTMPGGWLLTFVATETSTGQRVESLQIPITISAANDSACYAAGAVGPGAEVGYWVMATSFSPNNGTVTGYGISGAPLPDGVSWDENTGFPYGSPTSTGSSGPIYVTPQDSGGGQCASSPALGPFFIETVAGLSLDTIDLPTGTIGSAYSASLQASGGKPGASGSGYWFALQMDERLPPGLTLDQNTGAISGVPAQAGTYLLDFTVTDAWGFQTFSELTMTVN